MLTTGAVLLGGAILFQKRVVDTGWDPGARRDAFPPSTAPAQGGPDTGGPATAVVARTRGKIAPPPGAPTPPPPPEAG
ncbi:hypothetical protein [Streptomyces tubercidicus]|uniref:hypothetical protein n=1 Tax=Streptomyces tubercidicus TaxID=47759 RepID=UPI00346568CB